MNTESSCSREVCKLDSVTTGKIYGINGPVIYLKGKTEFKMSERSEEHTSELQSPWN